jgi:hypothetical protein
MAKLVPGEGMSLVRSIVSDIVSHKHTHFLTLGLVFTILDSFQRSCCDDGRP